VSATSEVSLPKRARFQHRLLLGAEGRDDLLDQRFPARAAFFAGQEVEGLNDRSRAAGLADGEQVQSVLGPVELTAVLEPAGLHLQEAHAGREDGQRGIEFREGS